jgi:hypothetical protein
LTKLLTIFLLSVSSLSGAFNLKAESVDTKKHDAVVVATRPGTVPAQVTVDHRERLLEKEKNREIVFRHGDISWLPKLAAEAGWPEETWEKLGEIILRESGGCPNRRGGDVVDKNCVITRVSEWNHRSDTGLLQINGTHWKKDHPQYSGSICRDMGICDQETLLDPVTNLKAGKYLYDIAGFAPWDPCTWKPEMKGCKKKKD